MLAKNKKKKLKKAKHSLPYKQNKTKAGKKLKHRKKSQNKQNISLIHRNHWVVLSENKKE